jgi:leucyl-tRNA synthetase
MYEMFLGPVEQSKPWDTMGIEGVSKFLRKFWALYYNEEGEWLVNDQMPQEESLRALHATIRKTAEDIERFSFNTAISQFMICVNELRKKDEHSAAILEPLVNIIAPFAPFIAEELWAGFGHSTSVHKALFPEYDEQWLTVSSVTYPVCINGKKRSEIELPLGLSNQVLEQKAKELPEIIKWIDGKPIRKVIIVPDKMINIVI